MRITPGVPRRLGVGTLVAAAVTGTVGLGTADTGAPTRALACPGAVTVADEGGYVADSPRTVVRAYLPGAAAYTRTNMTGRLDERRTPGGQVEVVARGKRHEPIAVFVFTPAGTRWSFTTSAQCAADGPDAFAQIFCPGQLALGVVDYGPGGPADNATPQQKLRHAPLDTEYVREHAAGPLETRYRYEGTQAEVVTRDAYRRPIAVYRFDGTPSGWQLSQHAACATETLPAEARTS